MSGDKCVFFNCNLSRRNSKNSFYSFPSNEELARKWILNSGNIKLVSLSPKRLKKRYICSSHFASTMYNEPVGTIRRTLKKNAVPMDYSLATAQLNSPTSNSSKYKSPVIIVENTIAEESENVESYDAKATGTSKACLMSSYQTLKIESPKEFVFNVQLNRPEKANAMNSLMWIEIGKCFNELNENPDCRVIVLTGNGKFFTSGIDLYDVMNLGQEVANHDDIARKSQVIRKFIKTYQGCITSLEKCVKPIIAAVHNGCIGGGVDLIAASDIRYCTNDAWFQIKETEIGMAADVGTLQRMPKIIGNMSTFNELAFTARKFDALEAKTIGFVTTVYETKESMLENIMNIANDIACKSPVGIQMTKRSIIYSRDHTVQEGLDHIADWNQILLQSEDFIKATMAVASKDKKPIFSKL